MGSCQHDHGVISKDKLQGFQMTMEICFVTFMNNHYIQSFELLESVHSLDGKRKFLVSVESERTHIN